MIASGLRPDIAMSPYTSNARATTPDRPQALISELKTAWSGLMFCTTGKGGHDSDVATEWSSQTALGFEQGLHPTCWHFCTVPSNPLSSPTLNPCGILQAKSLLLRRNCSRVQMQQLAQLGQALTFLSMML